jgi:two-component system chemotaxis sensor kinase CheA
MDKLLRNVEQSVLSLITVNATDLTELGNLHTQFQEIKSESVKINNDHQDDYLTLVENAAKAVVDIIETIIFDDTNDVNVAIAYINQTAEAIQTIVQNLSNQQTPSAVLFPENMYLNLPESSTPPPLISFGENKLPDNVDEDIFQEFLANQLHLNESLEEAILNAENDITSEIPVPAILQTTTTAEVHEKPDANKEDFAVMMIDKSDLPLVDDFIMESLEHLKTSEASLLSYEDDPENTELINAIFRAFHTIKGVAGFLNLVQIQQLAHAAESLLDKGRKNEVDLNSGNSDIVFESIDLMEKMIVGLKSNIENHQPVNPIDGVTPLIKRINDALSDEPEPEIIEPKAGDTQKIGEILIETNITTKEVINKILDIQKNGSDDRKLGEILIDNGNATQGQVQQALKTQSDAIKKKHTTESTVKVTTSRLDGMINMVGELVIAQSMVLQNVAEHSTKDETLNKNLSALTKITRDLQELSMSMRMVPVKGVFQKMARLVRDLGKKTGKQIEFEIVGSETEIDRNIVEAIADPLVHMVRNSADHGIELPSERTANGKAVAGTIKLSAFHQAGNIVIEISDDGRGLNKQKIREKGIKNGLIREGQDIPDSELFQLIFNAGFSTAEKITDISGRGVGMDVVKKNIESIMGRIDIISTEGKGSTFTISLPLTLAVIDGQIVTVGSEQYVIPTISIEESLRPTDGQIHTVQGESGEMMLIRGSLLPVVRLHSLFSIEPIYTDPYEAIIVVVEDGDQRCCLMVDKLHGQQQVVIKNLGEYFTNVIGVSGGAIMGDGNINLILDIPGVLNFATQS